MSAETTENKKCVKNKWADLYDIISDNAFMDWQLLAKELSLSTSEIDNIKKSTTSYQERCWKVLHLWDSRSKPEHQASQLIETLKRCRHKRMADIVHKVIFTEGTVDDVLAQHTDREERMREAFYVLAEHLSAKWRLLAQKLGLNPPDIAEIEARFPGRKREKLMHVLHKWRLLVPLQDYKVGNLIMAVKAAGSTSVAAELTTFTDAPDWTKPLRKRRRGEALVHVDIIHVDLLDLEHQPRRSQILSSKNTLRDYALNKILLHLADCLDDQPLNSTHPLVQFLYELNRSSIIRVSRGGSYVLVRCSSEMEVDQLRNLAQSGELGQKFTEYLVTDDILRELGVIAVELSASIVDEELLTSRSYASSRASLRSTTSSLK